MDTKSGDVKSLYNDFNHLGRLDGVTYKTDGSGIQDIEIKHPDNFFIIITIPDGIFEWFVDILDDKKNKLVSEWYDDYDGPEEVLKANRQKDIEEFVHDIINHKLRFVFEKKMFKEVLTVEILRDNGWTKLYSNSKLKIF